MNKSAIKQMAALVWFALMSVSLWGQGFHVYTKDGQRHDFLHADVDSIVFASDAIGEEQPPIELPTVAEAVDLGLPSGTKWASWNVGAHSPEEYGGYYAWGEVEEKSEYSWSNYKWCDGERTSITKYGVNSSYGIVDNLTTLDAGDDVAQMEWGKGWRMPTNDEIKELFDECKWSWTFVNGVNGQLVTGPNGNSIFMPAAGFYKDDQVKGGGSYLSYLSSSLYLDGGSCGVVVLYFFSGNNNWDDTWGRCYGRSVRPVYDDGSSSDVPENVHPVNTVGEASAITSESALVEGICNTVQGLGRNYQLGFLYNTTGSPNYDNAEFVAVDHRSTGKFSTTLEGLEPATTYYYCACIKVNEGIWYYGETLSFTTLQVTTGMINGYEWVNLGLPSGTKWASCNVGANSPEEYGNYYAWGEVKEKNEYIWKNYKWGNAKYSITKYNRNALYGTVDGKRSLEPEDDVAHVKWGDSWRMPTWEETTELYTNCNWQWTTFNGVYGQLVTGPNGNNIFLPAAGCANGTGVSGPGYSGFYWSAKLGDAADCDAYKLNFFGGDKLFSNNWDNRYLGGSIRPVCE